MKACIVPMPLIFHAGKVVWPFARSTYSQNLIKKFRDRSNAGLQISLALSSARGRSCTTIIVADDRFVVGSKPPPSVLESFKSQVLPDEIIGSRVVYESDLESKYFCGLNGCSGVWGSLAEDLFEEGFTEIEAWIPESCMANVAHATGLMQFPRIILHRTRHTESQVVGTYIYERGIYVHPESS